MRKIKVVLIAVAILIGTNVSAQNSPITFGVRAGVNLSDILEIYGNEVNASGGKVGFNAGITMDYAFGTFGNRHSFYLLTGLEFTTKGAREEYSGETFTLNLMYLQVPIHFGYKLGVSDNVRMIFRIGPYVAYGVGGNASMTEGGVSVSVGAFSDELDLLNRFDVGLGFGTGVEFNRRVTLGLGFDLGLLNISRNNDFGINNANMHFTVGYRF